MKWKMKDGKEIEISDMESGHLLCCIRMLRRIAVNLRFRDAYQTDVGASMMNGDMAQFCLQQDAMRLYDMSDIHYLENYNEFWTPMIEEAEKRGLKHGLFSNWSCAICGRDISHYIDKSNDLCEDCYRDQMN